MKGENLVHLKFEYAEALNGKKEILNVQKNIVNLTATAKEYNSLRMDELKLKLKLHRKIKELTSKIKNLHENFPHLNVEKIMGKEHERNEDIRNVKKSKEDSKKTKKLDDGLESQLREIQRKLNAISR